MDKLKSRGIKKVFAIPPSSKEEKWEYLLGFKDTGFTVGSNKLMVLSIWE
jgi:hypothetical protein